MTEDQQARLDKACSLLTGVCDELFRVPNGADDVLPVIRQLNATLERYGWGWNVRKTRAR